MGENIGIPLGVWLRGRKDCSHLLRRRDCLQSTSTDKKSHTRGKHRATVEIPALLETFQLQNWVTGEFPGGVLSCPGHEVRPRQATEICNFGVSPSLDFWQFLHWIRFYFFSKGSPAKISRKYENSRRRSMPNMIGRPGCQTTEMNGGSSASYLARTPCVPLLYFIGWKQKDF